MYFKRLEMQGFKSFVEPVVIDFHEGVTCIVGPNGSGKSNISDAIRWVLGEQSAKAIRASKMEDIIFSGTATRKQRGFAEVTLVIDNELGILPIEYNEVAITRRLNRTGESEYLINNNPCRLKDIKELIMDTGIGVDGYSVISQGKITELIESKPNERREIFEEAAGVMMYKSKKSEAERKLETTQINLDRVEDIVNELEGRFDTLKEESIKAKEYLVLKEKRKELEINIILRNVEKLSEATQIGNDDVIRIENEIKDSKAEKIDLDSEVNFLRNKSENLEEISSTKRDLLLKKSDELNLIVNSSQVNEEKLNAFSRDKERLNNEIKDINEKLSIEEENAKVEQDKINSNSDRINDTNINLQKEIDEYNKLLKNSLDLEEETTNLQNDIIQNSNKAVELRGNERYYESYKESLFSQKKRLLSDLEEAKKNRENVESEIEKLKLELDSYEESLNKKKEELDYNLKKKNDNYSKLNDLRKESLDIKINLSNLSSRKKTIEEMEANYEGYNGAVRFVMKEKFNGIHGVVGELIKVPESYEVAIETALGSQMQNVICDKDQDAKHVINELKNRQQGRLTFLPIESVNGKQIEINPSILSGNGFIGIASNLIKYDEKYKGIINFLLSRTIIVKDMDSAIKLSKIEKSSLRFVTLDGEVISSTGSITGGKYKNQTANLLARRNEIDELNKKINDLEIKRDKNANEITSLEKLENELISLINQLQENQKNIQIDYANCLGRVNNLEELTKDNSSLSEKQNREITNIEKDIINATNLCTKANEDALLLENKSKELTNVLEAKLKEFDLIKEQIANQNEKVTSARIKKTEVDMEIDKINSVLSVILGKVNEYKGQINDKNNSLENIKEEENKILFGSTDNKEEATKLLNEKTELEEYIKTCDLEKTEVNNKLKELLDKQEKLLTKINNLVDSKEQYQIKLAKAEANLDGAKEKLLNDFEISYAQALEYRKEDFVYSTSVKESREIKERLDILGDVNVGAITEFEEVSTRHEFLTKQRDDILKAKNELVDIIKNLDKTIKVKFKDNFDKVCENFEITFKELFGGGEAHLSLVDESNPLESGVDINVQPPGKKIQNIEAFSGGEKTMIGLALMMAVLRTKPTPFCILDEVEAALDDANIDKFANSLRDFNATQFTVITHQKQTMEHADVLYGVTMPEHGISKVLSLRLGDNFDLGDGTN